LFVLNYGQIITEEFQLKYLRANDTTIDNNDYDKIMFIHVIDEITYFEV